MRTARVGLACVLALAAAAPPSGGQGTGTTIVTTLTLFSGSDTGLWRSGNWGRSWERARRIAEPGTEPAGAVHAILALGSTVFVGGEAGVFVSQDFGQTWKSGGTQETTLSLLASRYLPVEPVVFAGTPGGLLRSEDIGASFQPTPLAGTPVYRMEWPGPAMVVATGRGVLVSPDGGRSFPDPPGSGMPAGDVRALVVSSFFASDPVILAGVGSHGLFRSGDAGKSWSQAGLAGHAITDLVWLGPFLYAATDQGLFRSEDTGKSWSPLGEGLKQRRPARLLFPLAPDSGAEVFVATDNGVFRSADGGQHWEASGMQGERTLVLGTFPPHDPRRRDKG